MTVGLHRTTAVFSAAALLSIGLVTAGAAHAATTPHFEPDPNASGTLSFYDANGQAITSGRTDSGPFAAYVVGSGAIRSGDTQAAYYFANPDSTKTTNKFNVTQPGVFTTYPTTAAPTAINTLSASRPVATGTAKDETLDAFESTAVKSPTSGYVNVVQVRLRTYSPNTTPGVGTGYQSADIRIDPVNHTWTELYPTDATAPQGAPGTYVALTPNRVLDTRTGAGAVKAPVGAHKTIAVQVAGGSTGVPAGVSAVVINVTVTHAVAAGFITAYGDGATRPTAANLNYVKGQTVPNLVVAPVSAAGKIDLYNGSTGTVDLVGDISGYFVGGTPSAAGAFGALAPNRVLDTRTGAGAVKAPVGAHKTIAVQVAGGSTGVPAGVSAVVINVTVTHAVAAGFITAYGDGATRPTAANLNYVKGQTVPNLVVAPVSAAGKIDLYNGSTGTVDLVGDISGYFLGGGPSVPGSFGAIAPNRVLDTRTGAGAAKAAVPAHGSIAVQVTGGTTGVPAGVTAVVINVTVTHPLAAGFITAYADGTTQPTAANLNYVKGQTVPNLVVAPVSPTGKIRLYNGSTGTVDLVGDVSGYITGSG